MSLTSFCKKAGSSSPKPMPLQMPVGHPDMVKMVQIKRTKEHTLLTTAKDSRKVDIAGAE